MAGSDFDRTIINPRERPLSSDINSAQSQLDRTIRDYLMTVLGHRTSVASDVAVPTSGFLNEGFKVRPVSPAAMQVVVKAGMGFSYDPTDVPAGIGGVIGLDDQSPYKPMVLLADQTFNVPAAPGAGLSRYDIIEVKPYRRQENLLSRDVLDPTTGQFVANSLYKTLAFALDGQTGQVNDPNPSTAALSYKVGQAGVAPAVPATTAGYIKIGTLNIGSVTASIDEGLIQVQKKLIGPAGDYNVGAYITTTGGAPAHTLSYLNAPPGVRAAVIGTAHSSGVLYIFAGNVASLSGLVVTGTAEVNGAPAFLAVTGVAVVVGSVSAPVKANLANAALTSPVLLAALGQSYIAVQYEIWSWSAPNIIANAASAIVNLDVQIRTA